jgi:CheY-like chemotaxis protein
VSRDSRKNKNDEFKMKLEASFTLLYIEDNSANLRLVMQLLERRPNIKLLTAKEPVVGLKLAAQKIPDIILLDINLPVMNGYDVLKNLRQNKVTKNIQVIAISANAMPKDIEQGLEAGFNEYITKPIDIKALLSSIDNLLADSVVC